MLRRNVLIFHAGALGDFILSWPLAMALGRLYPQSRIICVCAGQKGKLLERVLRLESADVESGWGTLFTVQGTPPESVIRTLAGAHTIVSFSAAADSVWSANVRRLSPEATVIFIDPVLPPNFNKHATEHLVQQLAQHPVIATATRQMLRSIAERGTGTPHDPAGPVLIHPGAGSPNKCWPLTQYQQVAEQLKRRGRAVRWVIGEVERDRWPASNLAEMDQPQTLVDLFDAMRASSAFIGNDSGPAHLAGIIGVPTVTLFGPTNQCCWSPMGPRVKTISRPELGQIGVKDVVDAV